MNDLKVRQAVAYGLDRAPVVRNFYAAGQRGARVPAAEPVRVHEQGPEVPVQPDQGEAAAQLVGLPRAVQGGLLVSDGRLAAVHAGPAAELRGVLGEPRGVGLQGRPAQRAVAADYVQKVNEGTAGDLNLIGWTGDFGDPDNFLGTFFRNVQPAVRVPQPAIFSILDQGAERAELREAGRALPAGERS